jgi:glucose/arabinose dehydrogenase
MRISMTQVKWIVLAVAIALACDSGLAQQPPAAGGRQGTPPPGGGRQNVNPFPRVAPLPFPDAAQVVDTTGDPIRVVPMFKGLSSPWSLAFLPNGDMLITEKTGKLRIARGGNLDAQPITGVPEVVVNGQGGLLEVAVHPQFSKNQFVYLTYSKAGEKGNTTALARGRFDGKALLDVTDIFVADNWDTRGLHFGSKLAFASDGTLCMTVGERNDRTRAQDTNIHGGKDSSRRSIRTAIATCRDLRSIPRLARCGKRSTDRREETS